MACFYRYITTSSNMYIEQHFYPAYKIITALNSKPAK